MSVCFVVRAAYEKRHPYLSQRISRDAVAAELGEHFVSVEVLRELGVEK